MAKKLLFVCAMNVCRSPLMAFTFADALARDEDAADWELTSSGTSVTYRAPVCELTAALVATTPAGAELADSHFSSPVDSSLLEANDMILVPTRSERSRLAQLSPATRGRTFTLREAITLGRSPVTLREIELENRARTTSGGPLHLGGYPAVLHKRRGLVVPPPAKLRLPQIGRGSVDPWDFPDVHHEKRKVHESRLKDLQSDVRTLHAQLSRFFDGRAIADRRSADLLADALVDEFPVLDRTA